MKRRWFRPGFAHADGAGRLGSLSVTLLSGSTIQFLGAVAGFVTVSVLVTSLGAPAYGVLTVILSLTPWLTIVDAAVHPATRLLVGESREHGVLTAPDGLLRSASRLAFKVVSMNLVTVVLAVAFLPLVVIFGADGVADRGQLVVSILVFSLPIIGSGPGAVYLGALEGVGRTVVASLLTGAGPLLALPFTVLATNLRGSLWVFALAQGLAVALPRYVAWGYWKLRPSIHYTETAQTPRLRPRLVFQMLFLSATYLVQTGFDPVIVSSRLGAEAAGAFGLANRIVLGAIIPVIVLTPLFGANLAAARREGWSPDRDRELRRLTLQAAVCGVVAGGLVVTLGPVVSRILGAGQVATPLSLYIAGGVYVFSAFASAPLLLAFSGPKGLARSVRLHALLAIANLALSLAIVESVGPSGPLWASAAMGMAALTYWLLMWVRHPEWLEQTHHLRGAADANVSPFQDGSHG